MTISIKRDFLADVREFYEAIPAVAEQAAALALNQVSERESLPMIRRDMRSQINFPTGYLEQGGRLGISRKARRSSLEVVITGRDRPTSLARFAPGQTPQNTRNKGVTVSVKRGRVTRLGRAFLVNLKNGNIGLATRDRALIGRAYKPPQLAPGLFLLYAPSVEQVFGGVADDALPEIGNQLSREFLRQFARLSRG